MESSRRWGVRLQALRAFRGLRALWGVGLVGVGGFFVPATAESWSSTGLTSLRSVDGFPEGAIDELRYASLVVDSYGSRDNEGRAAPVVVVLILAALAGGGIYLYWRQREVTTLDVPPIVDAGVAPVDIDAGETSELQDDDAGAAAPRLGGDAFVRRLVRDVSSSHRLEDWASADGLLKRIIAVAWRISEGRSPRAMLSFISIEGDFRVVDTQDGLFMDPASYGRYDDFARAVTSIDAEALGRSYAELRPYLDEAFAEASTKGERFDPILKSALVRLTSLRVPTGPIALNEKGAIYEYRDPDTEALSAAEKHLVRMGSRNARAIQRTLKRFGEAAGLL